MESNEMKKCPYCAEMIRAEAIKCRYCGNMLTKEGAVTDESVIHWRRVTEDKRLAGVCTGIAREFSSPRLILPLRLLFIFTTIFYGFGLLLYIVLWILMPEPIDVTVGVTKDADQEKRGIRKRLKPLDIALSLLLVATGIVLMLIPFAKDHLVDFPLFGVFEFPHAILHNIQWVPGLWIFLIVLGLLVILLGALRAFRFILGCGLIVLGSAFLFPFFPFLPRLLFFPGLVIIGLILLILGGIRLAFGSAKR